MTNPRKDLPSPAAVRIITRIAAGWAALGLLVQVIFAAVVAPALGQEMGFTIPGRGPTLTILLDTTAVSVFGVVFSAVAGLAAVAAILLVTRRERIAYAIAAVVCIVVPGTVGLVAANGIIDMITDGQTTTGSSLLAAFISIAGFLLGAISVLQGPKLARGESDSTF